MVDHTPAGQPWKLTTEELADLDWLVELDKRAARQMVNRQAAEAMDWGDLASACQALGYDGDQFPAELRTLSAPGGLVPVPTTRKRLVRPPVPFALNVAAGALRTAARAFPLDNAARRINSLRMQVGVSARQLCARLDELAHECLMVTLTYRGTNDAWQASHVRDFMGHVRKWCQRRGFKANYVWVAELQKRGVIHYHVALWVPAGTRLPKPDECGWWPHGMTRIEVARAAVPYLLKYLSKDASKTMGDFPKGARVYGVGGLRHVERRTRRGLRLPSFVQARSDVLDDWRPKVGGGWLSPDGHHMPSEFQMMKVGGQQCLVRVHEHARDWRPDGPFTWLSRSPTHVPNA